MKKYLTKRKLYIGLFVVLYLLVGIVSLFHSFAFFGLANNKPMSIMLGCCFEIGQVAVLMSLLTSKKDRGRVMPWVLMCILTLVQIIGNIFSSYKYMMTHAAKDLIYFKNPIFIWTDLPDNITTVIVTYIIGALLPIIALCMTAMVSNYIVDTDPEDNKKLLDAFNDVENTQTTQIIKQENDKEPAKENDDKGETMEVKSEDKPLSSEKVEFDKSDARGSIPSSEEAKDGNENSEQIEEVSKPTIQNHFVNLKKE